MLRLSSAERMTRRPPRCRVCRALGPAHVAVSDPDDGGAAAGQLRPHGEVFVLGHDDRGALKGMLPNDGIGRIAQLDVEDVLGVVSLGLEPARERRRQLRIDHQAH